ncbi:MAG: V-type ATP synthase subunit E [Actinomycetota bacterium]|nr:V-type ATP synthase subunit E [Actinomycetota bacterium]MDD5666334.1 V-type ATP synthase subunit E [Actinomycetota bacterium]
MSIEDILQALDDQCRQECQEIFSRAEAEAKQILDKAQVEAEAIRQAKLAKVKAEAQSETTSMLYSARLKSKNAVISAKEVIAEKALAQTEERLRDLRSRQDYPSILESLIDEGMTRISGKVVVHVDPADEAAAEMVMRKRGCDYELRSDIETAGGATITDADGRVRIVNTVEERLNRAREKLRMHVSGILFGEEVKAAAGGG